MSRGVTFQRPQLKIHAILFCEVWVGSPTPLTLKIHKELGLDTHNKDTKLALKLHPLSFQYAYNLDSARHALEKTGFKSHQQDQAW
eukprot:scaffold229387_cov31-Tisochrysis_lutea.AAC.1